MITLYPSDVAEHRSSIMLCKTANSKKKIQLKIVVCSIILASAFHEEDTENILPFLWDFSHP